MVNAEVFMGLPSLHVLLRQGSPLLPRNLVLKTFGKLLVVFSTMVNLLCLLYYAFSGLEVLSSPSGKAKLFCENFSESSGLDDSRVSLPVFPTETNLELHGVSMTPKMVGEVIASLDSSGASSPDCVPPVVLRSSEPELSYMLLVELFSVCLGKSCFPDCWKVSLLVLVLRSVGERSTAKGYHP